MDARQCRPGSEHKRAAARLDGGGVRCSGRCAKGARLEQDDVVRDVPRVRVDGRRHDVSEVVREEVGRVEAAVRGAVAPALPAGSAAGKVAQAPGAAARNAAERLYYQRHHLVALVEARVIVVAPVEGDVPLARVVGEGDVLVALVRARGTRRRQV